MKFWTFFNFCRSFLPSWIRIRIRNLNADPAPATQTNADPCGSGSETLLEGHGRKYPDPDPLVRGTDTQKLIIDLLLDDDVLSVLLIRDVHPGAG
jgi:hypothetical protein